MGILIIITSIILAIFPALALSAPETLIISGPSGTINSRDFAFYWTGRTDTTDSLIRGFYYRMDNGPWNWTQERSIVYYDFPEGTHRLEVKAVDSNNREDPSPAFRAFTLQQNFALEPNESPFSIQREFQNQLDNGIISDELKLEFMNNFRTLSQNATATIVTSGSKWLITDRNTIYKLRKEGNRINVYQDDLLFRLNSDLEGELVAGAISQVLRDEFRDNRITLSQNAGVSVIIQGSEWLIDSKYTVKKEGSRLNVYEDKLLFGIELFEYITSFLNNRIISPGLRQDFKLNNVTLSSIATVVVEESGKRWLINDQKTFIVIKETNQNKLNIFESINDSPSEAIPITPGITIKALSQPDSNDINGIDEDWFKFSIQAAPGQNKLVTVLFKRPNAIGSSIIRVYRYPEVSDGSEIARFTARYSQQTSISIQQSPDYLIRVTPGTGENPSAPYFLTAIVDDLAPGVVWEREPNNSSSNATDFPSIALSKANYWVEMIGSKWSENDNKDYFRLHTSISQPARLSLNMTNPQKGPALVKISPVYQLSSEIGRFQVNPGSNPQWKLEIGIKPGDYTIEVELPPEQDQDFLYFLTLQLSDFPSGETWELEPNDSPAYAVANPLFPLGLRFRASKGYLDTKDWYRINIPKNGILNITTSRILKSGGLNIYSLDPILQSPVGSPLAYQVQEEPQRDYINLDILAGSYFMEVDLSKIPGDYWIIAQFFTSVSHNAPIDKPLKPDDSLNVTLTWEPGNLAYFDIFEITGNNIYSSKPLNKTPVIMYDDGLHNDGQKDDGIYTGTYIIEPVSSIQYQKEYRVFINVQDKNNNTGKIPINREVIIDTSPPDDIPPEIKRVSHDATVPLRTGQKLIVIIEGEAECIATFDIGDLVKGLRAYDDGKNNDGGANDGKYGGSYTIKAEDFASGAMVTGYLTDKAGNISKLEAANPVDVVGNRPAINSIDHNGRLALGLGETLKVTMVADPDCIASFSIVGLKNSIPMYDDGQHDDGSRGDGRYAGSYVIAKGDGIIGATVTGRLVDRNGRESTKNAIVKVTIDAVPPEPVVNVKALDRSLDQGKFIRLTWDPSTAQDFGLYNIYVSTRPIIILGGSAIRATFLTDIKNTSLDIEVEADLTDYFFAVTAVDTMGNESELSKDGSSASGPVQSIDNLKPASVKIVKAVDRDGDFGGMITISWTEVNQDLDFAGYNIYQETRPISSIAGLKPIDVVYDRFMTVLNIPVKDEVNYYYAVTAFDLSGNESDLDNFGGSATGPVRALNNLGQELEKDLRFIGGPVGTINHNHVAFHWNRYKPSGELIQGYYIRLDNLNWQWTTRTSVFYHNLSPGEHIFSVRLSEPEQAIISRSFKVETVSSLEKEPNDSRDKAYTIRPGVMVRGIADDDWFRFHIPDSYRFTGPVLLNVLVSSTGPSRVTLYTAQPFWELSNFEINTGQPLSFPIGTALSSDYFIQIESDMNSPYLLAVTADEMPSDYFWEVEDNGSGLSANALTLMDTPLEVRGTNKGQGDIDYFKVHVPDIISVSPLRMFISFYKPDPKAVTTVEIYSATPDIENRRIGKFVVEPFGLNPVVFSTIANTNRDYFIKIDHGDELQNSIYHFWVSISQGPGDENISWESEPNDIIALANPLAIGVRQQGTSWDGNNDEDWFRINIPYDGLLSLSFSRPDGIGSSSIEVFDANQRSLGKFQSNLFNGQKASMKLQLKAGNYFVKVRPEKELSNAEYTLLALLIDSISLSRFSQSGERLDPEGRSLRAGDKIQLDLLWTTSQDGVVSFRIGNIKSDIPMENQGKGSYKGSYTIARGDNELNAPIIVTLKDKFSNSEDIEMEETVSIDTELPYIQEISHNGIKPLSAGKKLRVRVIGEPMASAKFDISGFKTGLDMYTMTSDMVDPPLVILNWDWKILTVANRQWLISGRIKNISSTSKDRVKVVVTFYDNNGKSIGESFAFTNPRDIPSGVTASFKIYRPYTGDINPKLKLVYGADEKLVGESINDGVYMGDYTVGNNDNISNALIICYLTDTAGNQSAIQADEKVSFDTIPPVILSLQHDASKVLVEGDILTVTMESGLSGEPDGIATFDMGDYKKELEMSPADANGKRFVGIYHIRAGDQVDNALIKGYLRDAAGNSTSFIATRPVSINTAIPDVAIVSHNAGIRPFIQGETLIVTVHTTPGSVVTFNVDSIPDRPMYDDGLHDDGNAGDGLYKGTYVIKKGDNVKNAKVKVKVTSPNGKIAIRESLDTISIDTDPPLAVNGVVGADRPDDEGGYIILRWNPSTSEDFHHYNIYQSEKPIINLIGLKPLDLKLIESGCSLMDARCSFVTIQHPVSSIQRPPSYFAVTAVDYATNESPITRESVTGPISSVDNLPPEPVQKVSAYDRAFDNGKMITVVWTEPSSAEDFYRYHIYMSNTPIGSTSGLTPVDMGITDRNVLTVQVPVPQDGVNYYFAVTAVDFSGNESRLTKDSIAGPVFSVDNIGIVPDTLVKITSGPIGEIHYDDVTFRWNRWATQSSEALSGYYYKLDNANWAWTNQTEVTYYNLSEGQHTFYVRADLGSGSQDPMPASRIFAIKRVSVSEMEPNNNIGSANWISKGITILGKSTDDDDKDWYKFHVESTSLITVYFNRYRQIAGSSGTTALSIYSNSQNAENRIGIFQITNATGQRGSFSVGAELGDYFILVDPRGESPESQYEISVTTSEFPENIKWEIENNDLPNMAQLCSGFPLEISGSGNKETDVDWYQLRLTGLNASLTNFLDVNFLRTQGTGNTSISLYAAFPVNESPKVALVSLNSSNSYSQNISLPVRTGDYFLKIDNSQEPNPSSIYSFRVALRVGDPSEMWELEPNSVLQFANRLPLNEGVRGTSWHPDDDLDWYRVRMDKRGTLVISYFRPLGTGGAEIMLKNANGADIPQVPPVKAGLFTGHKATIMANLNLGDYYLVLDPESELNPQAEYYLFATVLDSIKFEIQRGSSIQHPVSSIQLQPDAPLSTGDSIKLTATGISGNVLTFDIGDLRTDIPMFDDGAHNDGKPNDGLYVGTYTVMANDDISEAEILLNLLVKLPRVNWIADFKLENKVTIDTIPPQIIRVDHNARIVPLSKGKTLNVTMIGEAKALAAFFDLLQDLESKNYIPRYSEIPMKEDPAGTYTGSYTVEERDNLDKGFVICHLIDTAGNKSSKTSDFTVTFDTKPPEITRISHDGSKVLVEGDILTITVVSDTIKGKATLDINNLVTGRAMYDDGTHGDAKADDGIYIGQYIVQKGDNITDSIITIHLIDEAGNITEKRAFEPVSIDTSPPKIDSLVHNATKTLSEGNVLIVTLKGEPGNIATFDIGDFQVALPMYDDGTRSDKVSGDGIYTGTYVVKKGDNAKDARISGYLTDKNGNQSVLRIFERVNIDAVPPPPVGDIKAFDRPEDQGFCIILTWQAVSGEDFDHYNIYRESAPISSTLGLIPVVFDDKEVNLNLASTNRVEVIVPNNGINYYFAVTVSDPAGNESSVTGAFGPVKAVDNIPPVPVAVVSATDRPNDHGKTAIVSWTKANQEEDFSHYGIYLWNKPITSLKDAKLIMEVRPRDIIYFPGGDTRLGAYVAVPSDGVDYYFAVTAFDKNGNESSLDIDGGSTAGPVRTRDDNPPRPVILVDVYDTPQDRGGSIDVVWRFSDDDEISQYGFYLSQQPINKLDSLKPVAIIEASQTIVDLKDDNIQVIIYRLNTPADLVSFYVAVTAIDLSGNVSPLDSSGKSVAGPVQSVSNIIISSSNTTISAGFDPKTSVFIPAGAMADNSIIDILLPDDLTYQKIEEANRFLEKSLIEPNIDQIFNETARVFKSSVTSTLKPITITLSYPDLTKSISIRAESTTIREIEANLRIFRLNEEARIPVWEYVSGTQQVDTTRRTVSVKVTKLGIFRIARLKLPERLDNVIVYPNPFIPSQSINGYITFKNLTENATIQIFDMAGQHIRTMDPQLNEGGEARWDARNKKGEEVASGTYIFVIQNDSASYVGKVIILR